VVRQAKNLILSKNEGNILQDFIWQTTQFDSKSLNTPDAPVNKDTAKQHGDQALEGLRTLGTLLITNGQFRKLLNDFVIVLRDMAGDAAANAASRVKPSADALAQIDQPADDNTWHEKPDFSKDKVRTQIQGLYKGDAAKDAAAVANAGVNAAQPAETTADAAAGVSATQAVVAQKIQENIPAETQQQLKETKKATKLTAAEYRARAKEYLSNKVPEERREQTIWRLKKMILECQQHPDYQQAIGTLLDLAEQYGRHGRRLTSGGSGTVKEARSHLGQAEADLKTLIERFANGTSSQDVFTAINTIYEDADRDPELKNWFKSFDTYVRNCLQQQGYIMEDESNEEWNRLYDQGNYLLRQKYRGHTDRVINEVKFLAQQFDEDLMNKSFAASLQKLFKDLGHDADGKPVFKPHLIKDLTEIIIPAALESVSYIPIPRIEFSDSQIDAVVENLVLESDNFMPNVLEVASDHYFRWGRKNIANKNKNTIDIKVSGVQMDLRDVSYYVKRKQGFPALTDTGVANIFMGGDGFSFRMKLVTADDSDRQHFFKIEKIDVDVKNLKIKLVKSNHKMLFNLVKPIMLKVLRPVVQKTAEKQLKDQFNQFDQLMYQVKIEAERALDEAREDPKKAPSIYQRYVAALQKQMLQGKQQAEAVATAAADKKVNVAVTHDESIFPEVKLPGGISTKAAEYKELARKGEKWESAVFSIGSASKSTDVPPPPAVVRKAHDATTNGHGHGNGHANGNVHANGNGYLTGHGKPMNTNGNAYAPSAGNTTVTV
jgi:hypothetical protein